jgi:hypothetical protein
VSVILDGENCWEHYPGGGVEFLRTLYRRCVKVPGVVTTPIGEHLQRHPPQERLPRLFAGSWIGHNFKIWVGHEEDNTAWDLLHRTREYLKARCAEPGPQTPRHRAWEELYIAEGSDWFWWYGDEHSSAQDALFDHLFRKHLQNVYLLLGDVPPADLARPISRRGPRATYTPPRAFLDVKIDGRSTFFEWISAGRYTCQNERGTMAMAMAGTLAEIHFGFDLERLLIRIDCESPARSALTLAGCDSVRIGFTEPAGLELRLPQPDQPNARLELLRDGQPVAVPEGQLEVAVDQIIELAAPFDLLDVAVGQSIQFYVELLQGPHSLDRAPHAGALALSRPSPDFERIMWDV